MKTALIFAAVILGGLLLAMLNPYDVSNMKRRRQGRPTGWRRLFGSSDDEGND